MRSFTIFDILTYTQLSLTILIGGIGNAIATIVYYRQQSNAKFKRSSVDLLATLSAVDLIICVLVIPINIAMYTNNQATDSDILCKTYVALTSSNVPLSAILLALLATDRCSLVCMNRPLLSGSARQILLFLTCCLAVLLGILPSLLYGVVPKPVDANITEMNYTTDGKESRLVCAPSYDILPKSVLMPAVRAHGSVFIMAFIIVITSYIMILRHSFLHSKKMRQNTADRLAAKPEQARVNETPSKVEQNECQLLISHESKGMKGSTDRTTNESLESGQQRSPIKKSKAVESKKELGTGNENFTTRRTNQNKRASIMVFAIFIIFVLTVIPSWLVTNQILRTSGKLTAYLYHLHFIQNAANPVLYCFLHNHFKHEAKRLVMSMMKC